MANKPDRLKADAMVLGDVFQGSCIDPNRPDLFIAQLGLSVPFSVDIASFGVAVAPVVCLSAEE